MNYLFDYKGFPIRYTERGYGKNLVLLHGYLESLNVFEGFADKLSKDYRVITLDLPGHGKSDLINGKCDMEIIANMLYELINYLTLSNIHLFGHSMGGYAALAYAEKYPDSLESLWLLHSTPNPDTYEKKLSRKREIDFMKKGRKEFLCKNSIPNMFAEGNHVKFASDLNRMISMACNNSDEGIVAAINAMMKRKDRNKVLHDLQIPKFSFIGRHDSYIPYETALSAAENNNAKPIVLENSGHVGFIEEQEKCLDEISKFLH